MLNFTFRIEFTLSPCLPLTFVFIVSSQPFSLRPALVSTEVPPSCTRGCELCSEYNGCLKCMPKLFILLERNDIRQIGVCLASCPVGYFGVRNPDMNKCNKCRIENCEDCFSRNFCTKCKEGLYAHKGRCYPSCPDGFSLTNGTTECTSVGECCHHLTSITATSSRDICFISCVGNQNFLDRITQKWINMHSWFGGRRFGEGSQI
ncbi:hypothetical protein Z043_111713 [Scleropages formosus]|uniref:R-spondin Fu-CRD domain-containing protein n=1 Tax=Scleropages formosus TaxID=113540 RepID=A0A0P7V447_SCLFO|nr:hypothetical protein Z043_111713 [Scleropages formosus]